MLQDFTQGPPCLARRFQGYSTYPYLLLVPELSVGFFELCELGVGAISLPAKDPQAFHLLCQSLKCTENGMRPH